MTSRQLSADRGVGDLTKDEARLVRRLGGRLINDLERVILGRSQALKLVVIGLLSGGHVLLEDVPGTGKTLLAETLAHGLGCRLRRIQCTVDLLPSDLLGASIYQPATGELTFHPGPLAEAHLVLVDDINRAQPSTQSALLEAMAEGQVTAEGNTYRLADPFTILATQNPAELEGTFPLPTAQLDRFAVCVHLGYPPPSSEISLLDRAHAADPGAPPAVMDVTAWRTLLESIRRIHIALPLRQYVARLADQLRRHPLIALGPSPRACQALIRASQASAGLDGRTYALPDDVKAVLIPVLGHRLRLAPDGLLHEVAVESVLRDVMGEHPVLPSAQGALP